MLKILTNIHREQTGVLQDWIGLDWQFQQVGLSELEEEVHNLLGLFHNEVDVGCPHYSNGKL